ncbi:MAG: RsmE family RNA methyltransferase [Chloroflexia bacterium]
MHRFFVPPDTLAASQVLITNEAAHQITHVLRMRAGDEICLLDGLGWEYRVKLLSLTKEAVTGQIEQRAEGHAEPRHKIILYLSLLNKADKFEWALQKCTELGAAGFIPVRSARSVTDIPGHAKIERWQRIIQEAAEQSGRAIIPPLAPALTLDDAFKSQAGRLAIIPALGSQTPLKTALHTARAKEATPISIFIGPEGGFTPGELSAAKAAGVLPITLGPRTLRAETAAVATLTMALYELGEMEA